MSNSSVCKVPHLRGGFQRDRPRSTGGRGGQARRSGRGAQRYGVHRPAARLGRRAAQKERPAGWRRRRSGSACRDRRAAASHGTQAGRQEGPWQPCSRERVSRALDWATTAGTLPPPGSRPPSPSPPTHQAPPAAPYRAPRPCTHQLPDCSGESAEWRPPPRPGPLALPQEPRLWAQSRISETLRPRRVPLGLARLQNFPPARNWSPRRSVPAGFQAHSLPAPQAGPARGQGAALGLTANHLLRPQERSPS